MELPTSQPEGFSELRLCLDEALLAGLTRVAESRLMTPGALVLMMIEELVNTGPATANRARLLLVAQKSAPGLVHALLPPEKDWPMWRLQSGTQAGESFTSPIVDEDLKTSHGAADWMQRHVAQLVAAFPGVRP